MKELEIEVRIPEGHHLVGTRAAGDTVVVVFRPDQYVRPIGYRMRVDEEEDQNTEICSTK